MGLSQWVNGQVIKKFSGDYLKLDWNRGSTSV